MKNKSIFAEDVNYWRTGRAAPDVWVERTRRQIETLDGSIIGEGFGSDGDGRSAFMLAFSIAGDSFKIIWPVLLSKVKDTGAERRQAATMLYHYVKSVCLYAVVVGPRAAFFSHLMLPDGRVAAQVANAELSEIVPSVLLLSSGIGR
jgi:hypothetical protein